MPPILPRLRIFWERENKNKKAMTFNINGEQRTFGELLKASFKSADTEENIDVYFTRPIGLAFALLWGSMGIHPTVITILSMFLGAAAGYMFYFPDLAHNLCGVALLMLANFCDSTDGQMARIYNKRSLTGRVLDGFAGDVWFVVIYFALAFRMMNSPITVMGYECSWYGFVICTIAGFGCHANQARLADYYRQIHLFFLLGKEGSELDRSDTQLEIKNSLPKFPHEWFAHLFYSNYYKYCRAQEKATPEFQRFYAAIRERYPNAADIPVPLHEDFRLGSLPLMKWANALTFNWRAIFCYVSCLANIPWLYPLVEIVVFSAIYINMHGKHEDYCRTLTEKYFNRQ